MNNKKALTAICAGLVVMASCSSASAWNIFSWMPKNPVYVGAGVGYGNTFWNEFVAKTSHIEDPSDPTALARVSVPSKATGYGTSWQALAGVYFSRHFAAQFDFEKLPTTTVTMKGASLYDPSIDPSNKAGTDFSFKSKSYRLDVVAKYFVNLFHSPYNFYADIGPNWTAREDSYTHKNHYIGAAFGLGFNADFKQRYLVDLSYQFTTGAGQASIEPLYDYMPFTGSVLLSSSIRI